VHKLSHGEKGEDVFITPRSQVFPDICLKCIDAECPYSFNHEKLLKHKKLRKQLIDYVFDATLDDALAAYGLVLARTIPEVREFIGEMNSKPCYTKTQGKHLKKNDDFVIKTREMYFKALDNYNNLLQALIPCKPRVLIKRKEK
jgi:hypothetical protein